MVLLVRLALLVLALVAYLGAVGFGPAQWGGMWRWTLLIVFIGLIGLEITRSRARGRRA